MLPYNLTFYHTCLTPRRADERLGINLNTLMVTFLPDIFPAVVHKALENFPRKCAGNLYDCRK